MRNFAIFALALLCVGALSPLPGLLAQDETILTLSVPAWREDAFENPDMFSQFEADHPGVKVVLARSDDNGYFAPAAYDLDTHLESATAYVNNADVVYVSSDSLSIEATRAGLYLDLMPLANGDPALNPDDFFPPAYGSFQWDRGLWGLPVSMNLQLVIYDPAAFDAAGLSYPDEGWTLDDFANADRLLTERDDDGNVTRPGFMVFGSNQLLLRSLLSHGFYDPNTIPQQPRFTDPDTEALLESWIQYQDDGLLGASPIEGNIDFNNIPLQISSTYLLSSSFLPANVEPKAGALLPGGSAGLQVEGFAVSSGTRYPEMAYELLKYLSSDVRVVNNFFGSSPARRSLVGVKPEDNGDTIIFQPEYPEDVQALMNLAYEHALPASELRYATYIDQVISDVRSNDQDLHVALVDAEQKAIENLQAAADRRSTTVVAVATPVPTPDLSSGEVALKFGTMSFINPMPNLDRWDQVISDFVASDPEVRQVVLDTEMQPSLTEMAGKFDCFYLPFNNVNAQDINAVLSLDPFLDADPNFDSRDVIGSVMTQVERDNRTWAYPLNIQPEVLRYHSKLFADAGVPAPEAGWTTDAFSDALHSLKLQPSDPAPFQPREFGGNYILMLAAAYGGLPMDYRTTPPTIDFTSPATVEALRQVLDLAKGGYIQYQRLATFSGGGGGGSDIPIYNETLNMFSFNVIQSGGEGGGEDPYRITSFPTGSQYTPVTYDIGAAYISATSPAPEACYRWIATVAQHPELFTTMPARRSQLTNPELAATFGSDPTTFYVAFEAQLHAANVIEFPSIYGGGTDSVGGYITQFWLNRAMDRYVLEDGNLDTELADAEVFARDYQTCIADIPPFDPANYTNQREQINFVRQYFDCATTVDPSMASILPSLPEVSGG